MRDSLGCLSAVAVDPQNPDTVYVAMLSAGVVKIKSLDGGQSWPRELARPFCIITISGLYRSGEPEEPDTNLCRH